MTDAEALLEQKYQEAFEDEYRMIGKRRERDPSLTVEYFERYLRSLYELQDHDLDGRGALVDQVIAAQIAAHEAYIANWKKELSQA